jgi:hypothetical protein
MQERGFLEQRDVAGMPAEPRDEVGGRRVERSLAPIARASARSPEQRL